MSTYTKQLIGFVALATFLIALAVLLVFVSPTEIVSTIGLQNSYVLAFFISLIGGFSAGGSVSFISVLLILVAGGLNPIYLGLIAGASLAIGDMFMFYVGRKGRELVKGRWDKRIRILTTYVQTRPWLRRFVPLLSYIYIGLLPLPNDILILFLAAIKYPPKRVAGIILLGDLTFALLLTGLAAWRII